MLDKTSKRSITEISRFRLSETISAILFNLCLQLWYLGRRGTNKIIICLKGIFTVFVFGRGALQIQRRKGLSTLTFKSSCQDLFLRSEVTWFLLTIVTFLAMDYIYQNAYNNILIIWIKLYLDGLLEFRVFVRNLVWSEALGNGPFEL